MLPSGGKKPGDMPRDQRAKKRAKQRASTEPGDTPRAQRAKQRASLTADDPAVHPTKTPNTPKTPQTHRSYAISDRMRFNKQRKSLVQKKNGVCIICHNLEEVGGRYSMCVYDEVFEGKMSGKIGDVAHYRTLAS